jgi:hypothetical protein
MQAPTGAAYKRTRTFTQDTVPTGLLAAHTTKPGVWGRVVVEEGAVTLVFEADGRRVPCAPGSPGDIPPALPHHLEIDGPVRLFVEFRRG